MALPLSLLLLQMLPALSKALLLLFGARAEALSSPNGGLMKGFEAMKDEPLSEARRRRGTCFLDGDMPMDVGVPGNGTDDGGGIGGGDGEGDGDAVNGE